MIAVGSVLSCKAGEALIKQGELGNEMFILLSGAVESRAGDENGRDGASLLPGPRRAAAPSMHLISEC